MIVLTPAQMRDADAAACAQIGDVELMRSAGERVAAAIRHYAHGTRVVAFAGPGNNGGDAFAAFARLPAYERIIYAQPAANPSEARRDAEAAAAQSGVQMRPFPENAADAASATRDASLIVDALVGTGARLPLAPALGVVAEAMNASGTPVLAIDIPSGLDAETGRASEPAVRAAVTVTLGALKPGLLLSNGRDYVGDLWLADIGMPPDTLRVQRTRYAALDDDELLRLLPERARASDKRSAGAPLVIAGSEQFPGAAVLCAMGAARAGAGYVTVATDAAAVPALRAHLLEQVVVTLPSDGNATSVVSDLLDVAKRCSSVAIGPGLSLDDRTGEIVREFAQRCELPTVADASALFHFAKNLAPLRGKPIVMTPHEGEFARLSGKGTIKPGERVERLHEFVDRTGITTLLKGESTLVYDGTVTYINTTGTPALATAGTGDVLTGIIATLLAQGLSPYDAARAGAYWHGLAGRHAARIRPRGTIARDVYESLAAALPGPSYTSGLQRIF